MNILITGGSTNVMIDQVRCISNIFKGKTANDIYEYFASKFESCFKHKIKLLTSNREVNYQIGNCSITRYKTYDELYNLMENEIKNNYYDVIIHSAAVSDYKVEGTYTMAPASVPAPSGITAWNINKIDSSTKIGSENNELCLKLIQTEKIVDKIRGWGFKGKLVKFKLQVGITDEELIEIAKRSRKTSDADYIVANTLETAKETAFIVDKDDNVNKIDRKNLPSELFKILTI